MKRFWKELKEEDGVVEGTLVLLPTIFLALGILQIAISGLIHGSAANEIQGKNARNALLKQAPLLNSSLSSEAIPLSGGGLLLYAERSQSVPELSPLTLSGSTVATRSLVVDENQ